ncbi:two-component system, NtrC family, C4-dicarboxylate transport sensor histidine kinase DctB [Xaviernesmea oryzae]|uniref:C4-dicarboxylate transport sensor protein n=1 Tax=Xaviernesmea oryzae TaxID=464029 RepID=A0A1X7DN48_9HYPH|nr:two-component system, NtrC family, C4-dicarboxylate transport sensor histidine kinase DctB [Xaviernesmea oryzae]
MREDLPVADEKELVRRARRSWIAFALAALALCALTLYVVGVYARGSALSALEVQGRTDANLKVALLRAVLERPRALPLLLSHDRDVAEALSDASPQKREALSRKLEDLVAGTNASVLYVVGPDGITISASNWREATSFVGNDYAFRSYFSGAMQNGTAEHFALGTVSKRPGLYISQRVGPPAAPLGVVVVKMEFDQLERDWRDAQRPAFVVDDNHVVLITSIPSWRFMTTEALAAENLSAIRESLQFGDAPLLPLPFSPVETLSPDASIIRAVPPGNSAANYLRIAVPVASTDWSFQYLLPIDASLAGAMREARLIAVFALLLLTAAAAIWLRRRQAARMVIVREQMAREELERRVLERTRDLSLARDRLQAEITNHRVTEARLQVVQQDLVNANQLAILGQVAAGVAHEINQPVATIRAYADNSKVFLERQQTGPVAENLDLIAGLTERIGAITEDLKALARRGRTAPEPVELRDVIEGALLLLRSRFTGRLEMLTVEPIPEGMRVMGTRLRLEQVFINLFQNALEAIEAQDGGGVDVSAEASREWITVTVADNGPGIPPAVLDELFEPFNSSKEQGLGLGLVISKDIVTDYGGHIDVESGGSGTRFMVRLKKAAD